MTRGEEGGNDPWSAPLFTQGEPGSSACSQAILDPAGQKPNTLNPDLVVAHLGNKSR